MYTAGEYRSEYYPKEGGWSEEYSHYCSEYRSEACYVEELYEEYSPRFHGNVVDAVCLGECGCLGGCVDAEDAFHEQSVESKAQD